MHYRELWAQFIQQGTHSFLLITWWWECLLCITRESGLSSSEAQKVYLVNGNAGERDKQAVSLKLVALTNSSPH